MHQSWRDFVTTGPADRHVALFYKRDEFVHRCVAIWAAAALTRREGVILVGTPSKCVGIRRELRAHGVDVDGHEAAGRLVVVDAEMLMAHFTVNGGIDGATFSELVTTIVARVREATGPGARRIRAWGEMVDLFCERAAPEKAAELESLWEHALDRHDIQLLCSYRLGAGGPTPALEAQAASHTQALVEEENEPIEAAVTRSLASIFRERVPGGPQHLYTSRHAVKIGPDAGAVLVMLAAPRRIS